MPVIKVKASLCTGCRTCELICAYQHGVAGFNPALSRIWIKKEGIDKEVPVLCRQCRRPRCLESCPLGALHQDPITRIVSLSPQQCNACGACIEACPFQAIRPHPETGLPLICDLCNGEPTCVTHCPNAVLACGSKGGEEIG